MRVRGRWVGSELRYESTSDYNMLGRAAVGRMPVRRTLVLTVEVDDIESERRLQYGDDVFIVIGEGLANRPAVIRETFTVPDPSAPRPMTLASLREAAEAIRAHANTPTQALVPPPPEPPKEEPKKPEDPLGPTRFSLLEVD